MIPLARRRRPAGNLTLTNPGNVFNLGDVRDPPAREEGPPTMVRVRMRGMPRAASGLPAATLRTPEGFDTTRSSLEGGDPARWEGNDWLLGLSSAVRSLSVRYANGSELALVIPALAAGAREVVVEVPAAPAAPPVGVRVRGAVPGSHFFVGTIDATVVTPPDGRGARWEGNDWLFGVPHGTRSLRVVLPDGVAHTVALPEAAPGSFVTLDSPRPPPPVATEGRLPLRVRGARRDPAQATPTLMIFVDGRDVTHGQQPDGRAAAWDGNDWILGIPRGTASVQVRYSSGRTGTFALPADATGEVEITPPSDALGLTAADNAPLDIAPTSTLAHVRVWLIDPPDGTRLVRAGKRRSAAGEESVVPLAPLDGYTAQLNGTVVLPGSGRAAVPVSEHRLPDTADGTDRTTRLAVELPGGSVREVPLAPVPSDGILRVDLSREQGSRVGAALSGAVATGSRVGTWIVVGTLAAAGAFAWRHATRSNPSCGPSCGCAPCRARHNPSRTARRRR